MKFNRRTRRGKDNLSNVPATQSRNSMQCSWISTFHEGMSYSWCRCSSYFRPHPTFTMRRLFILQYYTCFQDASIISYAKFSSYSERSINMLSRSSMHYISRVPSTHSKIETCCCNTHDTMLSTECYCFSFVRILVQDLLYLYMYCMFSSRNRYKQGARTVVANF